MVRFRLPDCQKKKQFRRFNLEPAFTWYNVEFLKSPCHLPQSLRDALLNTVLLVQCTMRKEDHFDQDHSYIRQKSHASYL